MKMHKPNRWSKYLAAFLAAVMVLNSSSITAAADTLLQTETYSEDTAEQKAVVISGEDTEENSADQNETENEEQPEAPETPEQPDTNTTVDGEDQEKPETPETPETPSQSNTNTTVDGKDQEKPEIPETPSQSDTDATVDEDDQKDSEAPDQAMDATVTEEPTEEVEEVPAATKEDAEEEEEESFDGLLTIDELTALDDETVDATMWKSDGIALMSADDTEGNNWVFDAYYVNQDDPYYVEKTADFSLKYQMEFHTDDDLEIGAVQIRIPASIFPLRDGEIIMPSDIGVPHGTSTEDYKTSKTTPFNYYYEGTDENGKGGTLVFWNYKKISAGTNAAWQVLYKNLKVAEIKDQTKWSIKPEITVTLLAENEEDEDTKQTQATTPLEGIVDTQVTLNSVTKKPYSNGRSYTPGLYTESQVKSYLGYVPTDFADNYYVVWEVKVNASGNQPFRLDILDSTYAEPQAGGTVKGKIMVGSGTGVQDKTYIVTNYTASCDEDHDWNGTFTVVTAYPKSKVSVGDLLKNDVTVTLTPADGKDPKQTKSASAKWAWQNYTWKFEGNICRIDKYDNGNLAAALEILKIMSEKGQDYGSIPYTTQSYLRGYGYTHGVDSNDPSTLGVYKEGTYCETQVMDDFMAAYVLDEAAQWLDSDDYYYTKVSVEINDTGYDVWEDKQSALETPKGIDQSMTVYAMYEGKTEWEKVETIPWDGSGTLTYQFNEEQLAKKPWRVRVDHKTVNYSTTTRINVNVRLRHDSPIFTKILERYKSGEIQSFQLEDLSGLLAYGHVCEANEWQDWKLHQLCPNSNSYFEDYPKEFRDQNFELYKDLPLRNNAIKALNGLVPSAESWKESDSLNDPDNSRTLINYTLKVSDGYEVYGDEAINALLESGLPSPGRNAVAFYDLLPYGVQFNPSKEVKAYRISNGTKDDSQVSVKVDAETDYNGTGRTLLTFHIQYAGADSASYYYGKGFNSQNRYKSMWREAWQVDFQTYYDWKDIDQITNKGTKNIAAFMPEEEAGAPRYGQSLLGEKTEIYVDDPKARPAGFEAFGKKLQPNVTYGDGVKNVLYMSSGTDNDVAISNQSTITKLVKADSDKFGIFTRSAVTEPSGTYTYEITVNNPAKNAINGIVVYDNLENASAERAGNNDPLQPFENGSWYGTFQSINTTGLETLGITPTIYYNADRNAKTPNVTTENGKPADVLTEENGWYTKARWEEYGKTAAEVQSIAVDMGDFVLEGMKSISFQVKMKAPASTENEKIIYAYNNPAFYSLTEGTNSAKTTVGNSTRVSLNDAQQLEVIKKIGEDTPDVVKDNSFGFYLYEMDETENPDNTEKVPFAYQDYELYKTEDGGATWNQEDGTYGTDGDGYLKLKANEKAVFTAIPDASRIHVEEEESPYWDQTITDTKTAVKGIRTITFTNNYRRVLYAQKKLEGAPLYIDTTTAEFSFKVETRTSDEQDWSPLSNGTFWYVDSIRTDGGIPTKMTNRGDQGVGQTDKNGIFKIKSGEIAAIFMGSQEVQYHLTEVQDDATGSDWICKEKNGVTGIVPPVGTSATITNIYRWKDLYLTKDITHQDAKDCTQEFTFQIQKVDADGTSTPVAGNTWEIMGSDPAVNGTLNAEGKFKAACAGQIVRIRRLEAGQNYTVTETDHGVDYQPVSDSVDVTMPIYSSSRNATITNDYLLRPLSVSKRVLYSTSSQANELKDKTFTMTLTVDGKLWENKPYTLTENGKEVEGEYRTNDNGEFTLKNNQTATFASVGKQGTPYQVVETQDANYPQIYPASKTDGHVGEMESEGSFVQFINGTEGSLMISKEYVGVGGTAQAYVDYMKNKDDAVASELRNDARVEFKIRLTTADGDSYTWPGASDESIGCTILDQRTGTTSEKKYKHNYQVILEPWQILIIPSSALKNVISYDISESAQNQHRIFQCEVGDDSFIGKWMEVSQKYPENDGSYSGTLKENPSVTFVNQVTSQEGSKIEKRMALGSDEVPVGARLVWRLEQYDGVDWIPASDISYIMGDDAGGIGDAVQKTGEDGEITLTKTENGYPWIQFTDTKVQLNLYEGMKKGDLRLIELFDKSDEDWGTLAGYGTKDDPYNYFINPNSGTAVAFVNTNRTVPIEIEKKMEEASDEIFTMILEQVISASVELSGNLTADQITETRAGANMPYTIYDSATNEEVGNGVTTSKGELSMKAGQYVRLQVPDHTYWTVREILKPDYVLKDTDGTGITILGKNLLLLSAKAETIPTRLTAVFRNGQTFIDQVEISSIQKNDFSEVKVYWSDGTSKILSENEYNIIDSKYTHVGGKSTIQLTVAWLEGDLSTTITLEVAFHDVYGGKKIDKKDVVSGLVGVDGHLITINSGDVIIPSYARFNGVLYKIEGIASSAFYKQTDITSVSLPDGIKLIDESAFGSCANLKSIHIPDSVKEMGSSIFSHCSSLISVNIPKNIEKIPNYGFTGCTSLFSLTIPDTITTIGNGAFRGCTSMTTFTMPDSVISIGWEAFSNCTNLTSIVLPNKLQYIGWEAFKNCSALTEITIPEGVKSVQKWTFAGCSNLKAVDLSLGVETIKEAAFGWCKNLSSITFSTKLKSIEKEAFVTCTSLTSIEFPEGLADIGDYAFSSCESMNEVLLPESVETIGDGAFRYCDNLKKIFWPEKATKIGSEVFLGCKSLNNVVIPEGVTNIGFHAFGECESLTDIKLPQSLQEIGGSAFSSCGKLTNITLPESVKKISSGTFGYCKALKTINLENIESIGKGAFELCQALEEIYLSDKITSIADKVFGKCEKLQSIKIDRAPDAIKGSPWGAPNATITWTGTE